mmetsp:Transcript_33309/g.43942  ORF Transcript_33309/g.43942 Transcript_33309/m.43942 type:complete len:418 (-) Transcript_33309:334-1587(-)
MQVHQTEHQTEYTSALSSITPASIRLSSLGSRFSLAFLGSWLCSLTTKFLIFSSGRKLKRRLQRTAKKHNLFLMLGAGFIFGVIYPYPGKSIGQIDFREWQVVATVCPFLIFLINGLMLKFGDLKRAIGNWKLAVFAIFSIHFLTMFLGYLPLEITLQHDEYQMGFALFLCMPTTLASGVAVVNNANGNASLALLLTVISNLFGISTVPFTVFLLLSKASELKITPGRILIKLFVSILIPFLLGVGIQASCYYADIHKQFCSFVDKHKMEIKLFSNLCLAVVLWTNFSNAAIDLRAISLLQILLLATIGITLHLLLLFFHGVVMVILQIHKGSPREFLAVLFMASQKSLLFAATVISFFTADQVEKPSMLVIPCIFVYTSQTLIDAMLSSILNSRFHDLFQAADFQEEVTQTNSFEI